MTRRRIVALVLVAAGALWFQIAGRFESGRIDAQREERVPLQARAVDLRIDSDRLMSAVTTLADPKWEGRAAGSPGGLAARAWVVDRFKTLGLQPVAGAYVHPFTYKRLTRTGREEGAGANVLGLCVGTNPKLPYFVVSAHYDHVGTRDGQIHPGADDNASGVAVILEIAAFCRRSPFRRTIVFAAFDAEESGLQGARAFLVKPPVPKNRIALNVNLDMVSRSDKRELFVAGTYHYPRLKAPLDEVARRAPITLLFGHDKPVAIAGGVADWTNQSDHGPFHAAKIPFVYFGVEDHADYHKPTDTADKINRSFFVDAAETILDALLALDRAL
ncbi:MAG TPA: M28 family peptidase [Vicinamibacterales bacterium]|nr:M28 family peptidase [Vicinamibacterales bacterium]